MFLFLLSLQIQCVLYPYSTSQFGAAMVDVLNSHICLVASVLGSTGLESSDW